MLVRRSTLTFVVFAAGIFFIGSSFVVYQRPEYIRSDYLPDSLRDWSGFGSSDAANDMPLPAGSSPSSGHNGKLPVRPPAGAPPPSSGDDDLHILPIGPGDIGVRPLPVSSENSKPRPVSIASAALKERLVSLLLAPMPTYPQFMEESAESCPVDVADHQVNPDQHSGNLEKWMETSNEALGLRRLAIVQYLEELEKDKKVLLGGLKVGKGRGIVMTGGNQVCASCW